MNPYVLAWVVTALTGGLLSVVLLVESVLDLIALRGERNGRRWRVWGRISQEFIRLTVHVPFAIIGILALDAPVNPESTGTVLVLLYGNVAFILNSFIAIFVRKRGEESLEVQAEAAAEVIRDAADEAADSVRATATQTALDLAGGRGKIDRMADATERTADATERIADREET